MNLKILMMLLVYYSIIVIGFGMGGSLFIDDYTTNIEFNTSALSEGEIETGLITGIPSFSRFFKFAVFGVGLPDTVPDSFQFLFTIFQSAISLFTIGFIISMFWDG